MDCIIENDFLKVIANTHGGELHSIVGKKSGQEYIWKGLPYAWKLYAPVLFPIIGKVWNYQYKYNNKKFFMPEHGFASKVRYKLKEKKDNKLVFEFKDDEESKLIYPFKFLIENVFELKENSLIVKVTIRNLDNKEMYFSIGFHPSFKCPMYGEDDKFSDYYLEFNQIENSGLMEINKDDYLTGKSLKYLDNTNRINLSEQLLKNGTYIFGKLKSKEVTLKSSKHKRMVSINFEGFPYLALWGPDNMTEFICIEPWHGHADYVDFDDDISKKEGIISLKPNERYNCKYQIRIQE